jgi:hypothetical protein
MAYKCVDCGHANPTPEKIMDSPESSTVCIFCGQPNIIDGEDFVRPTDEQYLDFAANKEMQALSREYAKQYKLFFNAFDALRGSVETETEMKFNDAVEYAENVDYSDYITGFSTAVLMSGSAKVFLDWKSPAQLRYLAAESLDDYWSLVKKVGLAHAEEFYFSELLTTDEKGHTYH